LATQLRKPANDPHAPAAEKLRSQDLFRVRQGSYRILYEINDRERAVVVIKIGHRREVYR
jgi:mRNA interferase RelE/StbE